MRSHAGHVVGRVEKKRRLDSGDPDARTFRCLVIRPGWFLHVLSVPSVDQ